MTIMIELKSELGHHEIVDLRDIGLKVMRDGLFNCHRHGVFVVSDAWPLAWGEENVDDTIARASAEAMLERIMHAIDVCVTALGRRTVIRWRDFSAVIWPPEIEVHDDGREGEE